MVYEQLAEALGTSLAQFVATATEYLPNMLAAWLLIAAGWLFGRFVDSLRRLIHGVLHPFAKRSGRTAERDLSAERIGTSFGLVASWLVVAVFLLAAVRVLNLPILDELAAELGGYLPKLVAVQVLAQKDAGRRPGQPARISAAAPGKSPGFRAESRRRVDGVVAAPVEPR